MHYLRRSLSGIFLMAATLAILGLAGEMIAAAIQAKMSETPRERPQQERVLSVNAVRIDPTSLIPELTVYGEVTAGRTLDIRPSVNGQIMEVSESFRNGGAVLAGDLLLRLDPTDAQAALDRVKADRQDAESALREAQRALVLAQDELDAASQQARLRQAAYQRQVDLQTRGVGTAAAVETAELAASAADQAVLARRQSLADAQARIDQATTLKYRADINLAEAERARQETTLTASFDGTLSDVSAVEGGRVTANQLVATLIDPRKLEVAFRISTAQYSRLLDDKGNLILADAEVRLDVLGVDLAAKATLTRESASVAEGQSGRLVFASLEAPRGFRPGDFVTLTIPEPVLNDVALLPATAVAADNTVLVIGEDDRLVLSEVAVLRRQGNDVIVRASDLRGAQVVAQRSPILGAGIKVSPIQLTDTGEIAPAAAPEMVTLSPEQTEKLRNFVEGNTRMPDEIKAQILAQIEAGQMSAETLERLESRMGG